MGRPFLLGVLATLTAVGGLAALVVVSGVVDVAATKQGGLQDRLLGYASTRSIARHARQGRNPLAGDAAASRAGLQLYKENCLACHGGPGAQPEEFTAGLHPAAPDLASRQVQSFTDGMLYQTVAGGIGSTGMPAFGRAHRPDEIWSIVAFLRHLPALTPAERQELARGEGGGKAHGEAAPPPAQAAPEGAASAPPARGGHEVHQVSISNFKFVPPTVEAHVGDTVEWKNADFVAHTATAEDRSFDTGDLQAGGAKRIVVEKQGRFPYFCRYHIAMKGTLVVH